MMCGNKTRRDQRSLPSVSTPSQATYNLHRWHSDSRHDINAVSGEVPRCLVLSLMPLAQPEFITLFARVVVQDEEVPLAKLRKPDSAGWKAEVGGAARVSGGEGQRGQGGLEHLYLG